MGINMRRNYLDNIRWITVILVLVYHVFYLFNGVGVLGGIGAFSAVQYQDTFLYFVYPWFMVFLFVIAGMSTRYALKIRTNRQFLKERTRKLLVPSTLGLAAFQWIVGGFYMRINGGMEAIPVFLRYPIMALSGTGPLWFIQMLWLFSIVLLLIQIIDKKDRLYRLCEKCNTLMLLLLFLPIWGASQILNAPVITTYRFGIYFIAFLFGYFIISQDSVIERIEKIHIPMLFAAIIIGTLYTWYFFGTNYSEAACLKHIFTSLYLWIAVLAILGCGKAWLDKTSAFAGYMTKASFGIYIVHYSVTLLTCYLLKTYLTLPIPILYLAAIVTVLLLSPVLYEIIRHIPCLRFLVLGVKSR